MAAVNTARATPIIAVTLDRLKNSLSCLLGCSQAAICAKACLIIHPSPGSWGRSMDLHPPRGVWVPIPRLRRFPVSLMPTRKSHLRPLHTIAGVAGNGPQAINTARATAINLAALAAAKNPAVHIDSCSWHQLRQCTTASKGLACCKPLGRQLDLSACTAAAPQASVIADAGAAQAWLPPLPPTSYQARRAGAVGAAAGTAAWRRQDIARWNGVFGGASGLRRRAIEVAMTDAGDRLHPRAPRTREARPGACPPCVMPQQRRSHEDTAMVAVGAGPQRPGRQPPRRVRCGLWFWGAGGVCWHTHQRCAHTCFWGDVRWP
eukprot:122112-Chlamydomonas_euryale.AAC.5